MNQHQDTTPRPETDHLFDDREPFETVTLQGGPCRNGTRRVRPEQNVCWVRLGASRLKYCRISHDRFVFVDLVGPAFHGGGDVKTKHARKGAG